MPDIRTLLADTTERAPHADPVGAVRATVRRRATRRHAAVAAGTALAVVAVAFGGGLPSRLHRVRPAASPSAWRAYHTEDYPIEDFAGDARFQRMARLVHEHPDVFIGFHSADTVVADGKAVFAMAADARASEWTAAADAAAGPGGWRMVRCERTAREYDRIAAEVRQFAWPSGGHTVDVGYAGYCVVIAAVDPEPTAADQAAAIAQWGDAVGVGDHARG